MKQPKTASWIIEELTHKLTEDFAKTLSEKIDIAFDLWYKKWLKNRLASAYFTEMEIEKYKNQERQNIINQIYSIIPHSLLCYTSNNSEKSIWERLNELKTK